MQNLPIYNNVSVSLGRSRQPWVFLPPQKPTVSNFNSVGTITGEEPTSGYAVVKYVMIMMMIMMMMIMMMMIMMMSEIVWEQRLYLAGDVGQNYLNQLQ